MNHPCIGWVVSASLSLLALTACDEGSPVERRGGPPGSATACVAGELALPDGRCQPAGLPPDMTCPPGQRELANGSCQAAGVPPEACTAGKFAPDDRGGCDPILPKERCPDGQMAVPGESACREVAPCGDGPWNPALPADATTEHVDQRYPGTDSDGSPEKPWTTIQAAIDAASPGAVVAVADGRYEEDVRVSGKAVRLWGRCPARTTVVGRGLAQGAILIARASASGSEVRGLSVTGPAAGVVVQSARPVVLEQLWVHDTGRIGVLLLFGAVVTVRGALVERSQEIGVGVLGSEATVIETAVRATRTNGVGNFGWGIGVELGTGGGRGARGKLSLTTSLVEDNHEHGVLVGGSDATVEATVVRATQPSGSRKYGRGIGVQSDPVTHEAGTLSLTTSVIEDNHDDGVGILGSEATIETTVVRRTLPSPAGDPGWGINVQPESVTGARARLSLTSSLVEQNHDVGVYVVSSDATVVATTVRATQPTVGYGGRGITVQAATATSERGSLSLDASVVEENETLGVFVSGSDAAISSTVVRATRSDDAGRFGRGIGVQADVDTKEKGTLSLKDSLVEDNHDVGVYVSGADATIESTVVRATQPDGTGQFGRGISVQADPLTGVRATLSLKTSLVEENHDVGVLVSGGDATIASAVVRATQRAPAGYEFGDGILAHDEQGQTRVAIAATATTGNARSGVLYVGASGELSFVRASGNRFGMVVQSGMSGATPTLGEGNVIEGNDELDWLEGGDLRVPAASLPLP